PTGTGIFMSAPSAETPGRTDLGVWNVLANDAVPGPQATLAETLAQATGTAMPAGMLALSIARFKTAGLRDLGQSAPYFHNRSADALEDAVRHYVTTSPVVRGGTVRNGDSELVRMALTDADVTSLTAFLRALNEDYD